MSHFERDQHGFDDAIMPNFGSKKKHTKKTKKTKDLEDKLLELNLETTTTDEEEDFEEEFEAKKARRKQGQKKLSEKKKIKTPKAEEKTAYRPPYEWLDDDEEDEDDDSSFLPRVCTEKSDVASSQGEERNVASSQGEERNVAFEGFDITTFYGSERWQFESDVFGEDRIHRGSEKFSCALTCGPRNETVYFHFKSRVNLLKFQKRPRRYLPMSGGFCCVGVIFSSDPDSCCFNRLFRGDPSKFARKDQKVYMFADEASKQYFLSYAQELSKVCEEAFERRGFQENAEVCDKGYHDGHYAPFGKFDGYPEHFN